MTKVEIRKAIEAMRTKKLESIEKTFDQVLAVQSDSVIDNAVGDELKDFYEAAGRLRVNKDFRDFVDALLVLDNDVYACGLKHDNSYNTDILIRTLQAVMLGTYTYYIRVKFTGNEPFQVAYRAAVASTNEEYDKLLRLLSSVSTKEFVGIAELNGIEFPKVEMNINKELL